MSVYGDCVQILQYNGIVGLDLHGDEAQPDML